MTAVLREPRIKLKLAEIAGIAEIISAVAVSILLIYAGGQVNDSAGAVRCGTGASTLP